MAALRLKVNDAGVLNSPSEMAGGGGNDWFVPKGKQVAPDLIPYKNFTPEMKKKLKAVESGMIGLYRYIYSKGVADNTPGALGLGPNFDTCFWGRFQDKDMSYMQEQAAGMAAGISLTMRDVAELNGLAGASPAIRNNEAYQKIVAYYSDQTNAKKLVSGEELEALFLLNHFARQDISKQTGMTFCLKHFPGGGAAIDETHNRYVVSGQTLKELETGDMRPFIEAIRSSSPPGAIMLSNVAYPKAAAELLEKYSDVLASSPMPKEMLLNAPVTLNPLFVRYIREELGFEGLLVADSMSMDAAWGFASANIGKLKGGIRKLQEIYEKAGNPSENDRMAISLAYSLSVYAGVDMPYVFVGGPKDDGHEFQDYFGADQKFREAAFKAALESVYIKAKCLPADMRKGVDVSGLDLKDLQDPNLSGSKLEKQNALKALIPGYFEQMYAMVGELPIYRIDEQEGFPAEIKGKIPVFSAAYDVWNRWGLLREQMVKGMAEHIAGNKYDDIGVSSVDTGEHSDFSEKVIGIEIPEKFAGLYNNRFDKSEMAPDGGMRLMTRQYVGSGANEKYNVVFEFSAKEMESAEKVDFFGKTALKVNGHYLFEGGKNNRGYSTSFWAKASDVDELIKSIESEVARKSKSVGEGYSLKPTLEHILELVASDSVEISRCFSLFSFTPKEGASATQKYNKEHAARVPYLDRRGMKKLTSGGEIKSGGYLFEYENGKVSVYDARSSSVIRMEQRGLALTVTLSNKNAEWLAHLHNDPEYSGAVGNVDWNGIEMRSVFAEYKNRLLAGGYDFNALQIVPKKVE
ncbi:MAG: glycoside hydrolase family 3 N-terminal domain-containing protein [Candidatus Micrarchaeia archaeon]|jgi:hypothetical protein